MPKLSQIKKGIRNPKKACQYMLSSMHPIHPLENLYLFFTSRYPIGTHVFELEWDILVILDTCRVDAMRAVSQDYDFISNVNKIWSLGGTSP